MPNVHRTHPLPFEGPVPYLGTLIMVFNRVVLGTEDKLAWISIHSNFRILDEMELS